MLLPLKWPPPTGVHYTHKVSYQLKVGSPTWIIGIVGLGFVVHSEVTIL